MSVTARTAAPRVRANVAVPMADGVPLATDIYLPPDAGPVVVLLRTPYGKGAHLAEGLSWVSRGFGFVAQDVRGRYDSAGCWEPYAHERADGAAALAWLADQPWCAGAVVMGGSYASFTAWSAALSGHPVLRAVISLVPAVGTHVCYSPGGVLYLASHLRWWLANGDGATRRDGLFEAMYRSQPDLLAQLPVSELTQHLWAELPTWFDAVRAGPDAAPGYAITDFELAELALPTLHIGGWYDGFLAQTLRQWRIAGSAVVPRPARALLIGPWTHELRTDQVTVHGARRHGPAGRMSLGCFLVEWLGEVLAGTVPAQRAQVYVIGAERWDVAADWPVGVRTQAWYATPHGVLDTRTPSRPGSAVFGYDPADPFPSCCVPVDRGALDRRTDAVRYVSPPLRSRYELAGAPEVVLYAATDAPNTDWVARLLQVTPDGRRRYLTQGVVDAARVVGQPVAGQVHCYRVQLTPLHLELAVGERICLEITSSDFPDHARNLNTGADRHTTTEALVATQTVHCGPAHRTALLLPVRRSAVTT